MIVNPDTLRPIVNLDGQTCFGCGAGNPLGLHMTFQTDGERLYSFVTVPAAMAGWDRTVHGGIIATMLDEIMGWSVIALLGKIGVTKTMTVTFQQPIQVETSLLVVGAIMEGVTERQVKVDGRIYAGETLCATAEGTFAAMPPQTAVRLGVMRADYMQRFLPILNQANRD